MFYPISAENFFDVTLSQLIPVMKRREWLRFLLLLLLASHSVLWDCLYCKIETTKVDEDQYELLEFFVNLLKDTAVLPNRVELVQRLMCNLSIYDCLFNHFFQNVFHTGKCPDSF